MRRFSRILVTGVAAAAAMVMATGVASATHITPGTWAVSPGGDFDGTAGVTTLTTDSGVQLTCDSSTVTNGSLVTSATGSPAVLGTLPAGSVAFQSCNGPFGLSFGVSHVGTWYLNGVTYDAAVASGKTTGTITNIKANLTGFDCSATVEGYVNATYSNSTKQLDVLPGYTLTITWVDPNRDCFGLISTGDKASFDGTYTASPSTPQTITATVP